MSFPLIFIGKLISTVSRLLNIGSGGTWPGEMALWIKPDILKEFSSKLSQGSILVVGTNGKTTTTLMIKKILESEGLKVLHNDSGANLLNGVVSTFIQNSSWIGSVKADWGVFEIDENTLPSIISNYPMIQFPNKQKKLIIVFLNLFRDQLDRYGEVDVIAEKWRKALKNLPKDSEIILNADDPQIAYLGKALKAKIIYFGLDDPKLFLKEKEHATDSIFCLNCGARLEYLGLYYSHIGILGCQKCGYKRPKPEVNEYDDVLPGLYNKYNTLAAAATAKALGISNSQIKQSLRSFSPAFGRQEEFMVNGKKVKIFLSKNPAGFNEALRTVISIGAKSLLFVLNDRIPDGSDVSWIWDVDFEMLSDNVDIIVSGDRAFDMGLRIKYGMKQFNNETMEQLKIKENLKEAIFESMKKITHGETLYILPTYSAMLGVRKILRGRKIL